MESKRRSDLLAFTTAAKAVIYNEQRFSQFLPMMGTEDGAVQAVQTVIAAIEQRKPVPPEIAPLLGVNIYMLMVDMASQVTGEQPDEEIVHRVTLQILQQLRSSHAEGPETEETEAAEPGAMQSQERATGAEMPLRPRGMISANMGA